MSIIEASLHLYRRFALKIELRTGQEVGDIRYHPLKIDAKFDLFSTKQSFQYLLYEKYCKYFALVNH
jgi:hypothetical protein